MATLLGVEGWCKEYVAAEGRSTKSSVSDSQGQECRRAQDECFTACRSAAGGNSGFTPAYRTQEEDKRDLPTVAKSPVHSSVGLRPLTPGNAPNTEQEFFRGVSRILGGEIFVQCEH